MASEGSHGGVEIVEQVENEIEATDVEDLPDEWGETGDYDAALLTFDLARCDHEDAQADAAHLVDAAHIDDDRTGVVPTLGDLRRRAGAESVGTGMI